MLRVHNLAVQYGKAKILHGVSLAVDRGRLVALVGPNGAGKTTTLRAIAGLVQWDRRVLHKDVSYSGEVMFLDQRIDGWLPHLIVRQGLVLCPERRRPFREMTVHENLLVGAFLVRDRAHVRAKLEEVYSLFPVLQERSKQQAGTLSGGEQQMLAVARALMAHPQLLLIDEPSTGLAPLVKRTLFDKIAQIRDNGVAVLLVEQDAALALSIANFGYVLSEGKIVAQGENLLANDTVRRSFLGL